MSVRPSVRLLTILFFLSSLLVAFINDFVSVPTELEWRSFAPRRRSRAAPIRYPTAAFCRRPVWRRHQSHWPTCTWYVLVNNTRGRDKFLVLTGTVTVIQHKYTVLLLIHGSSTIINAHNELPATTNQFVSPYLK